MAKNAGRSALGTALSRRLDAAMEPLGYTNERWAELLGVSAGNVSHWRKGRHAPDVETTLKIAEIAGASDYYLLTGRPDPRVILARLQAARDEFRRAVATGEDPADAWERILGQPELLSEAERRLLSSESDGLQSYLASVDGLEWFSLTEEQRRLVRELMRLFARYRQAPETRTDPGSAPEPERRSE